MSPALQMELDFRERQRESSWDRYVRSAREYWDYVGRRSDAERRGDICTIGVDDTEENRLAEQVARDLDRA